MSLQQVDTNKKYQYGSVRLLNLTPVMLSSVTFCFLSFFSEAGWVKDIEHQFLEKPVGGGGCIRRKSQRVTISVSRRPNSHVPLSVF